MHSPKVSVVIPSYNSGQYLPEAIESALAQTYPNIEIIVVDDGSTDDTAQVVARYPQVRYLHQANGGVSRARNYGIRAARGQFIELLDADDVLLPTKVERCMAVFEAYPETGVVYTFYEVRTADMRAAEPVQPSLSLPGDPILHELLAWRDMRIALSSTLVRVRLFEEVGAFNETLRIVQDWEFWVRLAAHGVSFRCVPEVLMWYRNAPNSLSKDTIHLAREHLAALEGLRAVPEVRAADPHNVHMARFTHKAGLACWRRGERAAARRYFREANRLHSAGRLGRRLLIAMSYLLPARPAERIMAFLTQHRKPRES